MLCDVRLTSFNQTEIYSDIFKSEIRSQLDSLNSCKGIEWQNKIWHFLFLGNVTAHTLECIKITINQPTPPVECKSMPKSILTPLLKFSQ